jgi:hypothetical protein
MIWGIVKLASTVDGLGSPGRIRPERTKLTLPRPEDKVKPKGACKSL